MLAYYCHWLALFYVRLVGKISLQYHRTINYAPNIIIFGGVMLSSSNDNIYVINTMNNDIYIAGSWNYTAYVAPVILVWPVIYIFGGWEGTSFSSTYQYHVLKFSIHRI